MLGKDGRKGKRKGKDLEGRFYLVIVVGAGGEPGWLSHPGRAAQELGKGSVQHTNLGQASHLPSSCSPRAVSGLLSTCTERMAGLLAPGGLT